MTANGEVQTREEATEYVKKLDFFVTVMLLEDAPAVLSLGKLWEDHGYTYHWTSGQKPHLTKKKNKKIVCNISNYVPSFLAAQHKISLMPHLSFGRSLPRTQVLWRTIHTPCEIHRRDPQAMSPKWSSPKTLSPEESSLARIFGQIRFKHKKEWREITTQIPSPKIWMNLDKLVSRSLTSSHRTFWLWPSRK